MRTEPLAGEVGPIKITACGDILLGDFFFDIGRGIGSRIVRDGADWVFDGVRETLADCDLLLGNLECPVSDFSIRRGLRRREFLAPPKAINGLARAGFHVVSIANNHMSQHGSQAFADMVARLEAAGIAAAGRITDGASEQEVVIKEVHGRKVGLLAFSLVKDHYDPQAACYAHGVPDSGIVSQVQNAKQRCDILAVMMHWGEEFVDRPSRGQVGLAHRLIDAGCDLVLGSHPHVLQGVEIHRGKTIAYSLGNFVFSMAPAATRSSALLTVTIAPDGSQSFDMKPVWIDDDDHPTLHDADRIREVARRIEAVNRLLQEDTPDEAAYRALVAQGLSDYRRATKKRFLKQLHRLPPRVAVQLLGEFVLRRIGSGRRRSSQ